MPLQRRTFCQQFCQCFRERLILLPRPLGRPFRVLAGPEELFVLPSALQKRVDVVVINILRFIPVVDCLNCSVMNASKMQTISKDNCRF